MSDKDIVAAPSTTSVPGAEEARPEQDVTEASRTVASLLSAKSTLVAAEPPPARIARTGTDTASRNAGWFSQVPIDAQWTKLRHLTAPEKALILRARNTLARCKADNEDIFAGQRGIRSTTATLFGMAESTIGTIEREARRTDGVLETRPKPRHKSFLLSPVAGLDIGHVRASIHAGKTVSIKNLETELLAKYETPARDNVRRMLSRAGFFIRAGTVLGESAEAVAKRGEYLASKSQLKDSVHVFVGPKGAAVCGATGEQMWWIPRTVDGAEPPAKRSRTTQDAVAENVAYVQRVATETKEKIGPCLLLIHSSLATPAKPVPDAINRAEAVEWLRNHGEAGDLNAMSSAQLEVLIHCRMLRASIQSDVEALCKSLGHAALVVPIGHDELFPVTELMHALQGTAVEPAAEPAAAKDKEKVVDSDDADKPQPAPTSVPSAVPAAVPTADADKGRKRGPPAAVPVAGGTPKRSCADAVAAVLADLATREETAKGMRNYIAYGDHRLV